MSAILAVCGTAFCAMVSDGRMVEEPITDGKIKVLTDALPKVRKLNRNVLVGFAGDAVWQQPRSSINWMNTMCSI